MLLLLVMASAAAATPPPARAERQAQVSVIILRPHRASAETWSPASKPNQQEVLIKDPNGGETKVRLTEFE